MLRKATFNSSDKPKFREALIAKILRNPSIVKCSLDSLDQQFFWITQNQPASELLKDISRNDKLLYLLE